MRPSFIAITCGVVTLVLATGSTMAATAGSVRIKDIARIQGNRQHALVGYGLVTGLAGTGDSPSNRATRQSLANMLSRFDLTLPPEALSSRNVAVVSVSAAMPGYVRVGDTLDVTVTSLGDARSLVGGNLLLTPLKAANGKVYVLAQGPLTVGGYKYEANGTVGQKNHPTAATVPGGGAVEVVPPAPDMAEATSFSISLFEADYTNAARMADAINRMLGTGYAHASDPDLVAVQVPERFRGRFVEMVRQIESLEMPVDVRARIVVNERTGTVVSGAQVRIAAAVISQGELKVSIVTDNAVSQPAFIRAEPESAIRTESFSNSRIDLQESGGATLVTQPGGTVADLVQALTRMRTSARDMVSVLKALKAAGALHAELIVQ